MRKEIEEKMLGGLAFSAPYADESYDCGEKEIRKTGKNNKGYKIPLSKERRKKDVEKICN